MVVVEEILDGDAIHRQVDFPSMYNDAVGLIWDVVFQFPGGLSESVVWEKYAPTAESIHAFGELRETEARQRRPETDKRYIGFISSVAGRVRGIRTNAGHGFSVSHDPSEGLQHASISYDSVDGRSLTKGEKGELKLALRKVFGDLTRLTEA